MNTTNSQTTLDQLPWIHVEDISWIRKDTEKQLGELLGMKNKIGEAESLEGAIALLRNIIPVLESNCARLRLILLDQCFPFKNGETDTEVCSRLFVEKFAELQKVEDLREFFTETIIVIFSGSAKTDWLLELQQICPNVKGLIEKDGGEGILAGNLAMILEKEGVVDSADPQIQSVKKNIALPMFFKEIQKFYWSSLLEKDGQGEACIEQLLGLINTARTRAGLEILKESDQRFKNILNSVDKQFLRSDCLRLDGALLLVP